MLKWSEREEAGKTIRTATYQGYQIEVTATAVGTDGDFAAIVFRIGPFGGGDRDSQPHWGKSPAEALDRACRAAKQQIDADRLA